MRNEDTINRISNSNGELVRIFDLAVGSPSSNAVVSILSLCRLSQAWAQRRSLKISKTFFHFQEFYSFFPVQGIRNQLFCRYQSRIWENRETQLEQSITAPVLILLPSIGPIFRKRDKTGPRLSSWTDCARRNLARAACDAVTRGGPAFPGSGPAPPGPPPNPGSICIE